MVSIHIMSIFSLPVLVNLEEHLEFVINKDAIYVLPTDEELDLLKERFSLLFEYNSTRFEKIEVDWPAPGPVYCVQKAQQSWFNLKEDKKKPNIFQFFKYPDNSWIITYIPKSHKSSGGSWYCRDINALILLSKAFSERGMKRCHELSNSELIDYIREYNLSKILNGN